MGISQTPQAIVPAAFAAGTTWSLLNSGGTALTGADTITISGISNKNKLFILVSGASGGASCIMGIRLNGNTGSVYKCWGQRILASSTYNSGNLTSFEEPSLTNFRFGYASNVATSTSSGYIMLDGCNTSGVKSVLVSGGTAADGGVSQSLLTYGGWFDSSSVITSVSVYNSNSNFDAGTVYVYGSES